MILSRITPAIPVLALLMLATGQVSASSDDAWRELEAKMTKACLKASDLDAATIKWSNPYYETKAVALVSGKWRPKHMKGQKAAMLCLYDKRTGHVEVQEFELKLLK